LVQVRRGGCRRTVNGGLYNTKLDDGAQAAATASTSQVDAVWTIFGSSGPTSSSLDLLMSSSLSVYMRFKLLPLLAHRR